MKGDFIHWLYIHTKTLYFGSNFFQSFFKNTHPEHRRGGVAATCRAWDPNQKKAYFEIMLGWVGGEDNDQNPTIRMVTSDIAKAQLYQYLNKY